MSGKTKAVQTPYQQQQQTQNTYGTMSIANSPEARALLETPLDFGSEVSVDPGVARRTDLAEQEAGDRWDSAFNSGVPEFIREANRAKEIRGIRSQGAAEAAQAQYANQAANNGLKAQKTAAELERRRLLLPSIVQTGGSGSSSGYGTQVVQQPSFWGQLATGVAGGLAGNPKI